MDKFEHGPGGAFEIVASATPHPGNWMKLDPEAHNTCLLVRDIWDDWENDIGAEIHIELLDPRPEDTIFLTEDEIASRLEKIGTQARFSVEWYLAEVDRTLAGAGGYNRFWAKPSPSNLGGNPSSHIVKAVYEIEPDEALIVEVQPPNAKYWSLQVLDNFFQTVDYRFHQSSLNNNQAKPDADGKVRLVVSERDPGVPNWIDTVGLAQGLLQWRWYLSDANPDPSVRRLKLSDARAALPAETPMVTPVQRKAALDRRRAQVGRRFKV